MGDPFVQGMGANYGPMGYQGAGNLGRSGYQWSGPTNVGEIAYQQGHAADQANPWGGDAGLRPYNPAITPGLSTWLPPVFGNTMGGGAAYGGTASSAGPGAFGNTMAPESWNAIAASTRANQNPTMFAGGTPSMWGSAGSGDPTSVTGNAWDPQGTGYRAAQRLSGQPQNYGPGAGPMTSPYGPRNIAPDPGPNSSAWDKNNVAYNLLYGQGGYPANLTGTDLGNNNLNRGQIAFQNAGGWGNQTAGGAMRGIFGAESGGGNTFAINVPAPGGRSSGATGMNQLMNDRLTNYVNAGGGSFDYSPESQARNAVSEIQGSPRYGPTANALNDPTSTVPQMRSALISNYEGLNPNVAGGILKPQYNADMANAAKYGTTLTSLPAGWH